MATPLRLLATRICGNLYILTRSFNNGHNYYSQARNILACSRNMMSDRIVSLVAIRYPHKLKVMKCSQRPFHCSSNASSNSGHVLSTRSLDKKSEIIDEKENATTKNEEESDCLYSKVIVEVKGHDPAIINSYETFVSMAADGLDVKIGQIFTPPKVITRYTLLKSVHIFKKHRVQYENRTHYRVIEFLNLTGSTAETILEYIQRNLPEGMAMKVTKHRIETIPQHLQIDINNKQ